MLSQVLELLSALQFYSPTILVLFVCLVVATSSIMTRKSTAKAARSQRLLLSELDRCIKFDPERWRDESNWNTNLTSLAHKHNEKGGQSRFRRDLRALINNPKVRGMPRADLLVEQGSDYVSERWKRRIGWRDQVRRTR